MGAELRRARGLPDRAARLTRAAPVIALIDCGKRAVSRLALQARGAAFHAAFPATAMSSCRRGKLTRRLHGKLPFDDPGTTHVSGATTVDLRITITRLGPLRGFHC